MQKSIARVYGRVAKLSRSTRSIAQRTVCSIIDKLSLINRLHIQKSAEMMRQQIENEQLSRRMNEESCTTLNAEKAVLEVEMRQLMHRHQKELNTKDALIASVRD
jgi:uncharacterized protein YdeI (YjbR/CyaY-like superfamily)